MHYWFLQNLHYMRYGEYENRIHMSVCQKPVLFHLIIFQKLQKRLITADNAL